jgi:hypothetical protein
LDSVHPFETHTLLNMAIRPRLIAWAEPRHETILRSLIADNACELIGVCSTRASDAAALAQSLGTESLTDLRQAMLAPETEAVWLGAPATLDAALCKAIREHGLLVLTSEPMPALLAKHTGEPHEAEVVTFVPAFVDGAGFSAAQDSLEQFGPCQAMNLAFAGRPEHGSLFARLFDAMVTVRQLLGHAELIDATMTIAKSSVPDQLAGLDGTMTLNLRMENRHCASVLVSNRSPVWHREALIFGIDAHCMRITEETANWFGEDATGGAGLPAGAMLADPGERRGSAPRSALRKRRARSATCSAGRSARTHSGREYSAWRIGISTYGSTRSSARRSA